MADPGSIADQLAEAHAPQSVSDERMGEIAPVRAS
jgi:hypothetical protein